VSLLLVPPHGDFTLSPAPTPGVEVLDPGRDFIQRALTPTALAEAASRLERSLSQVSEHGPFRLLQVRAAIQLGAEGCGAARWLRAVAAALPGLSALSSVRLAIDDIQLANGTTERSRDALAAAERMDAPYQPELEAAADRCRREETVRLRLEVDQQLPAILFLARALDGKPFELVGRFARAHREALSRIPALKTGRFVDGPQPLPLIVGAPGFPVEAPLHWREVDAEEVSGAAAWAGRVSWAELRAPERLANSGCRLALLPFAALGADVLGADGSSQPLAEVRQAIDTLRARGVRVLGEWWIGAPGVGAEALARSAEQLEQASPFDGVASFRHFLWPAARSTPRWGSVDVQLGEPDADRDLARTRPFSAPGTLSTPERLAQIDQLMGRMMKRAPLVPGRVAQAYVVQDAAPAPRGNRLQLDPDCAVVPLPLTLEGEPTPTTYALNLRTGTVAKLAPPLVAPVCALRSAALPGDVFGKLPEAHRAVLVKALVDKSILREVT